MSKKVNQWFTLVELIVVITILAILWTIAFISLWWYSRNARDSARMSDISSIISVLEMYQLKTWFYPTTTSPVNITYSWSTAWNQWTFWSDTMMVINKLNKLPVDPLTWIPYAYSITNSKAEYEVATIMEWGVSYNPILNSANAATVLTPADAFVKWTYNWKIVKVSSWATTYILAVPSIINSDLSLQDIIQIINQKKLVLNWYSNLPDTYRNSSFDADWWFDYSPSKVLVFSWILNELKTDSSKRVDLLKEIQDAYSWTIIENNPWIKEIVSINIDTSAPNDYTESLAVNIINDSLKFKVPDVEVLDWSNASWGSSPGWGFTCNPDQWPCYIDSTHYVVSEQYPHWCKNPSLPGTEDGIIHPNNDCILKIYQNWTTVFNDYYVFPSWDITSLVYESFTAWWWNGSSFDAPTNIIPVAEPYCYSISYWINEWELMSVAQEKLLFDNYTKYNLTPNKQYWTNEFFNISSWANKYHALKFKFDSSYDATLGTWDNTAFASWAENIICVAWNVWDYIPAPTS